MKLLQLNIWSGKLMKQVVKLIEQQDADILCLQEVLSANGETIAVMAGQFSNLENILKSTGFKYSYFSPTLELEFSGWPVQMGNTIVSRYPLVDTKTVFVSGELSKIDVRHREPNVRNLQIVAVEFGGQKLVIANHHGYWDVNPLGNQKSVESMQKVYEALQTISSPLIFSGDFNLKSESPAMRVFDNFLEDLTAKNYIETTLTELNMANNVACDHIFVSPEVKVKDFAVLDDLVSDHKGLILSFDL